LFHKVFVELISLKPLSCTALQERYQYKLINEIVVEVVAGRRRAGTGAPLPAVVPVAGVPPFAAGKPPTAARRARAGGPLLTWPLTGQHHHLF
jgi:hypothetical protein